MTDEDRELIHSGLAAIDSGDMEELLRMLDPEIEWRTPPQGTLDPTYRGHEGVQRLFAQLFEAWERIRHEIQELIEVGDSVVVVTRLHLRSHTGHLQLDETWAYVAEIQGGRFVRVAMFTSPGDALRAAASAYLPPHERDPGAR
jgi:ketosteroid isomerase-like protein